MSKEVKPVTTDTQEDVFEDTAEADGEGVDLVEDDADQEGDELAASEGEGGEQPADPDMEMEAREMGWVPRDEFRGPDDQWRDAKEFVRRGKEILPIMRSQLSREKAARESDRKEFEDRLARMDKMTRLALDRQREQITSAFAEAKRRAVELGDVDAYDQLDKDQSKAMSQFDVPDEAPAEKSKDKGQDPLAGLPPAHRATYQRWAEENGHWANDPVLGAYAAKVHGDLKARKPGMDPEVLLAEVKRATRSKFPEEFGITQQPAKSSPVEGGGRGGNGAGNGKLAAKLPKEARATFNSFVEDGLYKPEEIEDYAKSYFSEDTAR